MKKNYRKVACRLRNGLGEFSVQNPDTLLAHLVRGNSQTIRDALVRNLLTPLTLVASVVFFKWINGLILRDDDTDVNTGEELRLLFALLSLLLIAFFSSFHSQKLHVFIRVTLGSWYLASYFLIMSFVTNPNYFGSANMYAGFIACLTGIYIRIAYAFWPQSRR